MLNFLCFTHDAINISIIFPTGPALSRAILSESFKVALHRFLYVGKNTLKVTKYHHKLQSYLDRTYLQLSPFQLVCVTNQFGCGNLWRVIKY